MKKKLNTKLGLVIAILVMLLTSACSFAQNNINPTESTVEFVMTMQESQWELTSMATGLTEAKSCFVSYSDLFSDSQGSYFEVEWNAANNHKEGFQRHGYLIMMVVCDARGNLTGRTKLIQVSDPSMLRVNRVYPVTEGQAQYSNVLPQNMGDYGIMPLQTSTNLTLGF